MTVFKKRPPVTKSEIAPACLLQKALLLSYFPRRRAPPCGLTQPLIFESGDAETGRAE